MSEKNKPTVLLGTLSEETQAPYHAEGVCINGSGLQR